MTKEKLKRYCFEQKRPGTDGVAFGNNFLYIINLPYIAP